MNVSDKQIRMKKLNRWKRDLNISFGQLSSIINCNNKK